MQLRLTACLAVLAATLSSASPCDSDHHGHKWPGNGELGVGASSATTSSIATSSVALSSVAVSTIAASSVAAVTAVASSSVPSSSVASSSVASSSVASSSVASSSAAASTGTVMQATTTRYYDGQEGACGCGSSSGLFSWQLGISTNVYTAAGSQALFDTDDSSWCGSGCGKCYNLTSTGNAPCSGCGSGGDAGESIIVMVTNLCPNNGNAEWCPTVGGTNDYGYSYHFDIMAQAEVFGDNPVVNFEEVDCPGQATTDWSQCVCA